MLPKIKITDGILKTQIDVFNRQNELKLNLYKVISDGKIIEYLLAVTDVYGSEVTIFSGTKRECFYFSASLQSYERERRIIENRKQGT